MEFLTESELYVISGMIATRKNRSNLLGSRIERLDVTVKATNVILYHWSKVEPTVYGLRQPAVKRIIKQVEQEF